MNKTVTSSTKAKEAQRRVRLQAQIDANLSQPPKVTEWEGMEVIDTIVSYMGSYSTKMMNVADQIILAVDKVESPEVKAGLMPHQPTFYMKFPDLDYNDMCDFTVRFSLNNGDVGAYKTLRAKMDGKIRKYWFEQPVGIQKAKKRDWVIAYVHRISEKTVALVFDLYDHGELTNNKRIPSVTATIELTKTNISYHPIKWEYVITYHNHESVRPKDTFLKSEYLKIQEFMRSILVSMGILPTDLDKCVRK